MEIESAVMPSSVACGASASASRSPASQNVSALREAARAIDLKSRRVAGRRWFRRGSCRSEPKLACRSELHPAPMQRERSATPPRSARACATCVPPLARRSRIARIESHHARAVSSSAARACDRRVDFARLGERGTRCAAQRPVIISCDGHATGRPRGLPPLHRAAYRDAVRRIRTRARGATRGPGSGHAGESLAVLEGGQRRSSPPRPATRATASGTPRCAPRCSTARAWSPRCSSRTTACRSAASASPRSTTSARAGNRAYDRWLCDFAERQSRAPGRARDAHRARPRRDGRRDRVGARQRDEGRDHPDRARRRAAALLRPVLRPDVGARAKTSSCPCTCTAAAVRPTTATTARSACWSTPPRPCTSRTGRCGS